MNLKFMRLMEQMKNDGADAGGGKDAADDTPKNDTPAKETTPNDGEGKTFTQDELEKIIGERIERARKKFEREYKERLESEAKKAKMDENERLKVEKEEAEKAAAEKVEAANRKLVEAEARLVAAELGMNPRIALKLADLSECAVDEGGSVTGVKEALEAAAKEFPEITAQVKRDIPGGSGPGGSAATMPEGMSPAQKLSWARKNKKNKK